MNAKLLSVSMAALLLSSFMLVAVVQAQTTSPSPTASPTPEQGVGGGTTPDGAPATGLGGS